MVKVVLKKRLSYEITLVETLTGSHRSKEGYRFMSRSLWIFISDNTRVYLIVKGSISGYSAA